LIRSARDRSLEAKVAGSPYRCAGIFHCDAVRRIVLPIQEAGHTEDTVAVRASRITAEGDGDLLERHFLQIGTGLPLTLVNNNDTSLLGTAPNGINNNGIDEPEYTPGNLQINHRPDRNAFNTSLFSLPALGTLGNTRRRFFYGPGMDNTDLALSKTTRTHDAATLEFRVEAFNLFNHGQFFGPSAVNGNISSGNFGQIQTASPPRLMQISARIQF